VNKHVIAVVVYIVYDIVTSPPVREWSIVCLFVILSPVFKSTRPNFNKFSVCVACGHGLTIGPPLAAYIDTLCTSSFMMTSYFHTIWTKWQHVTAAAAVFVFSPRPYVQDLSVSGGGTGGGRSM